MSTTRMECRRWGIAAAVTLFLATAGAAQPPQNDLLEQARRREEVARQKIEADLREGLRDAEKLAAKDPANAIERLKGLLAVVENDTALAQERRERLQRMLKDRIRVTEADPANVPAQPPKNDPEARGAARRILDEQLASERERLRREMEALRQKQGTSSTQDTSKQAADLARRNPTNPAAQANSRISSSADQVSAARRLELDRQRNLAGLNRELEKSATPPAGDLDFPKDWRERVKGRTSAPNLSQKEKTILAALSTPVTINFKGSRFDDVIEYLQTLTGQPILVDPAAMKEAEITYETPVTLNAKGITVRTALRKVLAELGLSYIIKEESIQVTTIQRVRETMSVRTYPVQDIVIVASHPGRVGFASPAEILKNVKELMALIQNSVDSASWQENGGTGTIAFHAPSMSIIVKQTAEVHMMFGRGSGSK